MSCQHLACFFAESLVQPQHALPLPNLVHNPNRNCPSPISGGELWKHWIINESPKRLGRCFDGLNHNSSFSYSANIYKANMFSSHKSRLGIIIHIPGVRIELATVSNSMSCSDNTEYHKYLFFTPMGVSQDINLRLVMCQALLGLKAWAWAGFEWAQAC